MSDVKNPNAFTDNPVDGAQKRLEELGYQQVLDRKLSVFGNVVMGLSNVAPVMAAVLKSPGEMGADVAVADGQTLGMAPSFGGPEGLMPLWWALSLGACLGGNGTLIGASASVV